MSEKANYYAVFCPTDETYDNPIGSPFFFSMPNWIDGPGFAYSDEARAKTRLEKVKRENADNPEYSFEIQTMTADEYREKLNGFFKKNYPKASKEEIDQLVQACLDEY